MSSRRLALSAGLALIVACGAADQSDTAVKIAEVAEEEAPRGDFHDYNAELGRRYPIDSNALVDELRRVAGASGPRAPSGESEFFDVLRTNRGRSSALIIEALETHPDARDAGRFRLLLLFALGEVSHASQVQFLETLILRCVGDGDSGKSTTPGPSTTPGRASRDRQAEARVRDNPGRRGGRRNGGDHVGDIYGPAQDARIETVMAIKAFEKVVARDKSVPMIRALRSALDRVVDERRCNRGAMATAVLTLIRYASDERAERKALEKRLGSRLRYLARVRLVHELPGGNEPRRVR